MIVSYLNESGTEILICEKKNENKMLKEWFATGNGRNPNCYYREESENRVIRINTRMTVNHEK